MVSNLLKKGFRNMSFSVFQVRRPSGRPQGLLNLGLMVHDWDFHCLSPSVGYRNLTGEFPLRPKNLNSPRPSESSRNVFEGKSCRSFAESVKDQTNRRQMRPKITISDVLEDQENVSSCQQVFAEKPSPRRRVLAEEFQQVENDDEEEQDLNTKQESRKPAIGCYNALLNSVAKKYERKVNIAKKLKSHGAAKIHLSPSDNMLCSGCLQDDVQQV
eukprot:TRINITY_DN26300_c0_g3_i1.p1 TRINITY_DN26300_c0_g3~~TRINITY_DN26300_c0_g3_i1.p1  ORF type:complete len:224 (+),score=25.83 TRINITY_DN26300_c0_g3_i1:28-672(+)